MRAKVVDLITYKRKKRMDDLSVYEYIGIILNVIILSSFGMYMAYTFYNPPIMKWLGNILCIALFVYIIRHIIRVIQIFRLRRILKEMEYLSAYVLFVTFLSPILPLVSFTFVAPFLVKLAYFFVFITIVILNILLLKKLSKKNKQHVRR